MWVGDNLIHGRYLQQLVSQEETNCPLAEISLNREVYKGSAMYVDVSQASPLVNVSAYRIIVYRRLTI
jgi:hypothetical protein